MTRTIVIAALCLAASGFAQNLTQEPADRRVDFSEVELTARRLGPLDGYVTERLAPRFKNQIKIRQNFDPELERSVDAIP